MRQRGFTLVEVLTALALLSVGALASAQLLVLTAHDTQVSRVQTTGTALAEQKIEQLLALTWSFDDAGLQISDPGLSPAPPNALDENVAGYVEFLDLHGTWLAGGASPPPNASYVRRWSVDIPADGAADSRVIRVLVRSIVGDAARARGTLGEVRLVTLRTRMGP